MSPIKVRVAVRARAQITAQNRWWRQNRPENPALLREELAEATVRLTASPAAGMRDDAAELPGVRRLLLPRTQHYLYYVFRESTRTVQILAIRHTARGVGPEL